MIPSLINQGNNEAKLSSALVIIRFLRIAIKISNLVIEISLDRAKPNRSIAANF